MCVARFYAEKQLAGEILEVRNMLVKRNQLATFNTVAGSLLLTHLWEVVFRFSLTA